MLGLLPAGSAPAAERAIEDHPAAASVYEMEGAEEKGYVKEEVRPSLFPWVRRWKQKLPPFFADSELALRYRTYYLRQDRTNKRLSEAWAMGGSLYYRSGWLKELLAVELEGFTSQPIVAPDGRDGTLLLAPDQDGYTVLGVANGKLRHGGLTLTGFRQEIDLPYLNKQDNRMTPNTFEAAKLSKEDGALRFKVGYAWNFKARNSDSFVSLSERAGVSQSRGAAFADVLWTLAEKATVGGSAVVVPDLLSTVYAEAALERPLTDEVGLRVEAQFTYQHSVGKELVAGSPFDSWNVGLRAAASWRGAVLRLGFAATGDERRIETFFGSSPSYISLMQRTFNQADEKALLVGLSYHFDELGVPNLSAIANFAQGWDGLRAGERGEASEVNLTFDYRIGSGLLETLWLRLRGSWLHEEVAPRNGTDVRVIFRYELPVL